MDIVILILFLFYFSRDEDYEKPGKLKKNVVPSFSGCSDKLGKSYNFAKLLCQWKLFKETEKKRKRVLTYSIISSLNVRYISILNVIFLLLDSVVVNDVEYENIDFQKGKISIAAFLFKPTGVWFFLVWVWVNLLINY